MTARPAPYRPGRARPGYLAAFLSRRKWASIYTKQERKRRKV